MLGINGVTRIAGLMQRSLDDEVACPIGRRRTTDVMVAFDEKCFAPCLCNEPSCRQSAQATANDDNVVALRQYILTFGRCSAATVAKF